MEFKQLGKSGIKISSVGLGTWQWGSREWGWGRTHGKQQVIEAVDKALELGINLVDTAEVYGGGKSEELLGEAIKGHRDEVVIASKVWPLNLSSGRIMRAADRSARRLGVDVIDLYQIHWPNPIFPIRNTMKTMKKLVQLGKVRSVGISNFSLNGTKAAKEALLPLDLASNQVKYNLLERDIETNLLRYAQSSEITVIAYSPLAGSLLTGRYTPGVRPATLIQAVNPKFSSRNLTQLSSLLAVLSRIGTAHNRTPSQVALNWLISKPNVVAIPGTKNATHVADTAGAADWHLTETETAELESAAGKIRFDYLSGIPNLLRALVREIVPSKKMA